MNERRRFLKVLGSAAVTAGTGCYTGSATTTSSSSHAATTSTTGVGGAGTTTGMGGASTTTGGGMGGASTTTGGGMGGAGGKASSTTGGGACGSGGATNSGTNNDTCGSNAGHMNVGMPAAYASQGLYKTTQATNVLIGKDAGGLYAMSSLCTHQCCDMNSCAGAVSASGAQCYCHGSSFDLNGVPNGGPAGQALDHYELSLGCDGILYADTTKIVAATTRLKA